MVSSGHQNYFQNPMLWLLPLVWIVTCALSVTESALIELKGEIGGNVTIHCPVIKKRECKFFYLQRGQTFVNGYHTSKDIGNAQPNTRVDPDDAAVHIYRLNISHSGEYQCHIQYSDGLLDTTVVHLSVTANYSKPTVTVLCRDLGFSCLVTCASHGGYPAAKMMWNVHVSGNTSSQMWKVVNNSEVPNPSTMMINSSSTAYFNCSNGELKSLSCSVGEITSDMFSVCTPKNPPVPHNYYVIAAMAAVCLLVFVSVIMVVLKLCRKYKKRQTGAAECKVNGCAEEVVVLKVTDGKETS